MCRSKSSSKAAAPAARNSALPPVEAARLFDSLSGFSRLAVAVSGGPDSMALLWLLAQWRASLSEGPELSAVTVDHGLRAEAAQEAALAARLASDLGLPHRTLPWAGGAAVRTGVQEKARQARYRLMAEHCHGAGIEALVTAHHLDDQAETLLMRLKRGSGLDGLAAIPARSEMAGITVLRPLLGVAKARLVATAEAAGIGFADDPSNRDLAYERARLRAEREALSKLGLTAEALARSARRLARAREALDIETAAFLAAHGRTWRGGYATADCAALLASPDEIALRALQRLIGVGGGEAAPLRLAKLEALWESLQARSFKGCTAAGCRIVPGGGEFAFYRETRPGRLPVLPLAPGESRLWDNRFVVSLTPESRAPCEVRGLGQAGLRQVLAEAPWLSDIPRPALPSLPALWRKGELIAVGALGYGGQGERKAAFSARFVHR